MSKGSAPRPIRVDAQVYADNWNRVFNDAAKTADATRRHDVAEHGHPAQHKPKELQKCP